MILGYAVDAIQNDRDVLHYNIDIALREVLDRMNIAIIDKNTRSRIVNSCLENKHCKAGKYTIDFLKMLIRNELSDADSNTRRELYGKC